MYLLVKSKSSQSVLLKFSRPALLIILRPLQALGIANVVIDEDEDEDEDEEPRRF